MAHVILQLNDDWRIVDDPPQWALQNHVGNSSTKDSGWRNRKFIRNRDHLLRRIGEICGEVDPGTIEIIKSWPEGYVTWKARELRLSAAAGNGPYGVITPLDDGAGHRETTPPSRGGLDSLIEAEIRASTIHPTAESRDAVVDSRL